MRRYGTDEYGRYFEEDGERYMIERWPFGGVNIYARVVGRWWIVKWYVATRLGRKQASDD